MRMSTLKHIMDMNILYVYSDLECTYCFCICSNRGTVGKLIRCFNGGLGKNIFHVVCTHGKPIRKLYSLNLLRILGSFQCFYTSSSVKQTSSKLSEATCHVNLRRDVETDLSMALK